MSPSDLLATVVREDPPLTSFIQALAPEGVWLFERGAPHLSWVSLSFWRSLGYEQAPSLEKLFWEQLIHCQDVSIWQDCIRKVEQGSKSIGCCELRYRHRDGGWVRGVCRLRQTQDASGQTYLIAGHALRRREIASACAEAWMRSLSGNRWVYALEINLEGHYTYLNDTFCRVFDIRAEDGIGGLATDNILPEYHAAYIAAVEQCLAQPGIPVPVLLGKPGPQGYARLTNWEFAAGLDANGEVDRICALGADVAEQHETQLQNAFQAKLLASVGQAVIATDTEGIIQYWNQGAQELYGWHSDEVVGQSAVVVIPNNQSRKQAQEIMAALMAGNAWRGTFEVKHKHGHIFLVEVVNNPVFDDRGQLTGVIGVSHDISERLVAQRALEKSERKYRFLFDHIKDLICLHTPDGTYQEVSPVVEKLLGYQPHELVGRNPYDFYHPDDIPRVQRAAHQQVLAGKASTRIQCRIRAKQGEYLWFDILTEPIVEPKTGEVTSLMTTSRDITELKALHEEKEQLSRLLQAMLSNTDDFIFFKDHEHRFITASQSVLKLLAIDSMDQLAGKRDEDFVAPTLSQAFLKMEKEVFATGRMVQEIQAMEATDTVVGKSFFDNRKYPITDDQGHVVGLYGIVRDITPLKEAEQELARSTELLLEAQRLAHVGSFYADMKTGTWVGSRNFIEMFGLPEKKLYLMGEWEALIHPEDHAAVMDHFDRCLAQQQHFEYEYRVLNQRSGNVQHVFSRSRITYAEDGTPLAINGVNQDITERKKAEETKQMVEQLAIKNKEMEQFAYVASHDLQEPLRTIGSYISLLEENYGPQLGGDAAIYMEFVASASQRMSQLISGLLDYSRLGKDRVLTQVDANALLHLVRLDLGARLRQTGAQLTIAVLPTIAAYELELRQLFQNLISNALKFQRPGVQPQIEVGAFAQAKGWVFFVKDNGIGIEAKFQAKIFQLFQRLHHSDTYEGTGIGLAHCKKIVELHHGQIWVESEPGQGSTFYFTISPL